MLELDDIFVAYFETRKNKRKSRDQVEFEVHWEMNCMCLYQDIIDRNLHPTAYTFVTLKPQPREIFASCFRYRILHHLLHMRLNELIENKLSDRTFNNRKDMGPIKCWERIIEDICDVSKGFTQDAWIVKLDIKGCFPNMNQDIAYKLLEDIIINEYRGDDKEDLIYILQKCIYSYPALHCEKRGDITNWSILDPEKSQFNKPPGIGAAPGHLIWQFAENVYFNDLDHWVLSWCSHYSRFVDDMIFVIPSKNYLLMIPEIRKRLGEIEEKLNEKKFYCQHYTKGVNAIGVTIKLDRLYISNRILRNFKQSIYRFNSTRGKIGDRFVKTFIQSTNSYLGLLKSCNEYSNIIRIINIINNNWKRYVRFNNERRCLEKI